MTAQPDVVILADHPVLLAIPAFAPAVIVVGVVVYVAMRDRRRGGDESHNENSDAAGQDGAP